MIAWLDRFDPFPPVTAALTEPDGLLAAGGDLTPERLIEAYSQGIFPWFAEGQPVLWWSTNPRMVLFTEEFRVSHSLRKTLMRIARQSSPTVEIRCDSCFEEVMRACAMPRPGQDGTWLNEEMIAVYTALHRQNLAHSVETWIDGQLAGGLYGVAIGRMFFGESMFTRTPNASKIALAHLVNFLRRAGFPMIDCQQQTSHLASLGARPIHRGDFIDRLHSLVALPGVQDWPRTLSFDPSIP